MKYYKWDSALNERFVYARDVRVALKYTEVGEVGASVVFASDALHSKKVKILDAFPEVSHSSIEFISFRVTDIPENKKFYEFLTSEAGLKTREKHGFLPIK